MTEGYSLQEVTYRQLTPPERGLLVELTFSAIEEALAEAALGPNVLQYEQLERTVVDLRRDWEGPMPSVAVREAIDYWLSGQGFSPAQIAAMVKED